MTEKDEVEDQLQMDRTKRKQKLQQLVQSIMATKKTERQSLSKHTSPYTRSGRGRGRRSEYKVPIGWQHFSKGKYRIVMQRNGGGTRYIYKNSDEEVTVDEILVEGKAFYFKDGKSKFGLLEEMAVTLVTASGQEISGFTDRNGLPCCFTEYVKAYGLYPSQCHLYLRTKIKSESDTDKCLKTKEESPCFLVNNIKAGLLEISYEKKTQSVYADKGSSIFIKSYRTAMSLAKDDLEEYNVFNDGYSVISVQKDNKEYLVDNENVYYFPQVNFDPNQVVCFIHGPNIIHGSETDDLNHLIIGCLTIFHIIFNITC
ncbi:uncharacterized protein LOC132716453 [Ruditapes philippinarum]|uniref:uncharacterized protein LOC132716453 n=1 Tax=Ruditapes philippinarum TaxID=129788 RepID=UPI00295B5862|nr:uncharacterized protein LOC132716453 [Ruditapes philippinarum]